MRKSETLIFFINGKLEGRVFLSLKNLFLPLKIIKEEIGNSDL
jgi:hypothetical protein